MRRLKHQSRVVSVTTVASFDLNLPLPWSDRWVPSPSVSHDAFFVVDAGHETGEVGRATGTLSYTESFRNNIFGLSIGTTLYAITIPRLRPFVQMGYRYEQMDLKLTLEDHDGVIVDECELAFASVAAFAFRAVCSLIWPGIPAAAMLGGD